MIHYRTGEVAGIEIFYREAGNPRCLNRRHERVTSRISG
jgi:hypothetical protein